MYEKKNRTEIKLFFFNFAVFSTIKSTIHSTVNLILTPFGFKLLRYKSNILPVFKVKDVFIKNLLYEIEQSNLELNGPDSQTET